MNLNPFEILKNAQKLQEKMGSFQERLATTTITGSAGGGLAQVVMNGKMDVLEVRLAPEVVNPAELGLLQDLIRAAFIDASEKAREAVRNEFGSFTGGLDLPPGMMGLS